MENIKMDTQLGKKWFIFYARVRPWLACVFLLPTIADFIEHTNIYFNNWWILLSLAAAIANVVLAILVFVKSKDDYVAFVRFVEKVLLFETVNVAYQQSAQQYIDSGFDFGFSLLMFAILLVLGYFLWYRLNVKYFNRRLHVVTSISEAGELPCSTTHTRYCTHCGNKLIENSNFCSNCGSQVIRN